MNPIIFFLIIVPSIILLNDSLITDPNECHQPVSDVELLGIL